MANSESQNTIPCSTSSSSTYLAIPSGGRMARSSSHESFATDVSLLSLSSFTSEIPTRVRSSYDKDDDPDSDRCDQALARYREDMFEKMLETHAMRPLMPKSMFDPSFPKSRPSNQTSVSSKSTDPNRSTQPQKPDRSKIGPNGLTRSEEELLKKCADSEPRIKGSLYKSFSTSDVLSLSETLFFRAHSCTTAADSNLAQNSSENPASVCGHGTTMKTCVSQSWIPNDYARASQRRRRHLEYLKRMCTTSSTIEDEWNFLCREDHEFVDDDQSQDPCTPDTTGPSSRFPTTTSSFQKKRFRKNRPNDENRKSNSDENLTEPRRNSADLSTSSSTSKQILLKKFNLSKEMGSRIRDDLMQKLNKHKKDQNMSVTKNDLEREKGRPLTRLERNFIIFHWLQSLDDETFSNT